VIELIKHTLGLCGDHWHPNIWTLVTASPMVSYLIYWIKDKL